MADTRSSVPAVTRRSAIRALACGGAIAAFPALLGCAAAPGKKASSGAALTATAGSVVMVIRHGEKPAKSDTSGGIAVTGAPDTHSLTSQGWTRAAHLVDLFVPDSTGQTRLPRPAVIYASGAGAGDGEGTRPRETVGPLAAALNIPINTTFSRGQETQLAQQAATGAGPTLICWQHESIPTIGAALTPANPVPPTVWPDDRYDMVWVFTATATGTGGWRFEQVPERLLPDDRDTGFS